MQKWITKEGKEIKVSKMDDPHLLNSLNLLKRKDAKGEADDWDMMFIKGFKKEIKKREYKRLQKRVARIEAFLQDNGAYDESLTS